MSDEIIETEETTEESHRDLRRWFVAAAVVFLALWIWREVAVRAAREHIASRDAEVETLKEQNAVLEQRANRMSNAVAVLAGHDTRILALAGQEAAPTASGRAFIDSAKHDAVVFFSNLPQNAKDKNYQLWILDGKQPRSAGAFDVTAAGTGSLAVDDFPDDAKALAVTLEPKGGVPQPTSATYYLATAR